MKLSKYIAAALFFALFVFLNTLLGASFQPSLCYYQMLVDNLEEADAFEMDAVARKHNTLLFTVENHDLSMYESQTTVYAAKDHLSTLWEEFGLEAGSIRHPLDGTEHIVSKTFAELEADEKAKLRAQSWYLIGELSDCKAVLSELKREYDYSMVGHPPNGNVITDYLPAILFGFSEIILLLYCYLDSSFKKKEIAIRVLHGESTLYHYIRCSLSDTVAFSAIYFLCIFVQQQYTQIMHYHTKVYWLFVPFLLCVWLVNLHLLRIQPKEMLYGHQLSERIMKLLSVFGKVSSVLCCISILLVLSSVPSLREYRMAETIFENNQNYVFFEYWYDAEINDKMMESNEYIMETWAELEEFYQTNDIVLQPITLDDQRFPASDMQTGDYKSIYANHRALSYLQTVIPEASDIDMAECEMALLIPACLNDAQKAEATRNHITLFSNVEGYTPAKIKTIVYTSEEQVLCFNPEYDNHFTFHQTPVVSIASNTYARPDADTLNIKHRTLESGSIFLSTNADAEKTVFANYTFNPILTNSYDKFQMDYHNQKMFLLTAVLLAILVLTFYIMVTQIILKLDYQVNAVELAIKKTLGYSIFQKNQTHFISAACCAVLSAIAVYLLRDYMHNLPTVVLILVPIALLLLNLLLLQALINRIEKQKLCKILKGGAL